MTIRLPKAAQLATMVAGLYGLLLVSFKPLPPPTSLAGAFSQKQADGSQIVLLFSDNYFSLTAYNEADRKFLYTWGGPFSLADGKMEVKVEFDTYTKTSVGQMLKADLVAEREQVMFNQSAFKRLDNGTGGLSGCWRISGRMQNGSFSEIPKRARKTLKLLTGTRFQWMAINNETGEFFGTGGGRYTFENGKYTEHIEFFSRDSSRVGASLSFDGKIEDGKWRHSGKSSKGDPIDEVWTREEQ